MNKKDILRLLNRILAPLLIHKQYNESDHSDFEKHLMQALTQQNLIFRKNSMLIFNADLLKPTPDIISKLNEIADQALAARVDRKPDDPVYWVRERDSPLAAGPDDYIENFLAPEISFGPFMKGETELVWFDFYAICKQLVFEPTVPIMQPRLIIALHSDELPAPGTYNKLDLEECTIWIALNNLNSEYKNYFGLRTRNTSIKFQAPVHISGSGKVRISPAVNFTLHLDPIDMAVSDVETSQHFANYPQNITFSFSINSYLLSNFAAARINMNGSFIPLNETNHQRAVQLNDENLVFFPLNADGSEDWLPTEQETEEVSFSGSSTIENAGWYIPVIQTNDELGRNKLGRMKFSGFLGFRGKEGISMNWRNLEYGNLTITRFLMLASPGRKKMIYTYSAEKESVQHYLLWKENFNHENHSHISINPLKEGSGRWICDLQNAEWLFQPVAISANLDRPVNGNQERFQVLALEGIYNLAKINDQISFNLFGITNYQDTNITVGKRRIPQSLCLQNA
jgi:hypothetical protein